MVGVLRMGARAEQQVAALRPVPQDRPAPAQHLTTAMDGAGKTTPAANFVATFLR